MVRWYARASRSIRSAFGRYASKSGDFGSSASGIPHSSVYRYLQRNIPSVDDGGEVQVRRFKIRLRVLSKWICAGSVAAIALYYRDTDHVPYIGRRQYMPLPTCREKELGRKHFEAVKSNYGGKIVSPHHPHCVRVQKIGGDIVEVVKSQIARMNEFEWEFVVVDEPTVVNCSVCLGGKVVVFTGLINQLRGDDEFATVIAHEVCSVNYSLFVVITGG